MGEISYIPTTKRWKAGKSSLESLLLDFQKIGGEPAFLLRVLEHYDNHPVLFTQDSNPRFHRSRVNGMLKAAQILEETGFEQNIVDAAMLCAAVHQSFVKLKKGLKGRPVQCRCYYWVGALRPYLILKGGGDRWRWLEDWITYGERSEKDMCNSLRISVPKGTGFLRTNPTVVGNKQQKIIHKSLLLGIQAGLLSLGTTTSYAGNVASIAQRIQAILQRIHTNRPHPKHYELMKNMCMPNHPKTSPDNSPLKVGETRLINMLIPPKSPGTQVRCASRKEKEYYERARFLWPGLEPGLKASILQLGVNIQSKKVT